MRVRGKVIINHHLGRGVQWKFFNASIVVHSSPKTDRSFASCCRIAIPPSATRAWPKRPWDLGSGPRPTIIPRPRRSITFCQVRERCTCTRNRDGWALEMPSPSLRERSTGSRTLTKRIWCSCALAPPATSMTTLSWRRTKTVFWNWSRNAFVCGFQRMQRTTTKPESGQLWLGGRPSW